MAASRLHSDYEADCVTLSSAA